MDQSLHDLAWSIAFMLAFTAVIFIPGALFAYWLTDDGYSPRRRSDKYGFPVRPGFKGTHRASNKGKHRMWEAGDNRVVLRHIQRATGSRATVQWLSAAGGVPKSGLGFSARGVGWAH